MPQTRHESIDRPLAWIATIVGISALAGVWQAYEADTTLGTSLQTSQPAMVDKTRVEEIEAALAQVGCPGWMVLASEGEAALGAHADRSPSLSLPRHIAGGDLPARAVHKINSQLVPAEVRKTSERVVEDVPRVQYPVPLRVASLPSRSPSLRVAQLSPSSPDDPDDLLNGMPDLIHGPGAGAEPEPATEAGARARAAEANPIAPPAEAGSPEGLILGPTFEPVFDDPDDLLAVPPQSRPVELPASPPTPADSPFAPPPTPEAPHAAGTSSSKLPTFCEFVAHETFPSAEACSKCHEKIYDEWRGSSHAYAMISPMFHKFEQKINDLSQGTVGYFCYRCHSPVGTTLGISRVAPLWELPPAAREGVTCVACHRVNQRYGKVNGERRIEPGDIHAPVYGSIGGGGVAKVLSRKNEFQVKTSPDEQGPGQDIHVAGLCFDQLSKPEFCVSCHQVAVQPGIKLEVVWEQYRASPACKKGISCQDCHMGRLPGVPSGYEVGPAAIVNGKVVHPRRKHANHVFYGPGYSIAHPGIFPPNPKANRWSMRDWLMFDYRAGWGTEEFEKRLEARQIQTRFPRVWAEIDDRYDAREIIADNIQKLQEKTVLRHQLMENGSHVDGPFFDSPLACGQNLKFHYVMTNTNEGHNLPSGSLGAQPQLWANVVLVGPRGNRLWESGYTDRWGDVADIHSEDVRHKRIPYDWQLFNLQTMFLITGAKGADREFFLPLNVDFDQLPFLRPGVQPISVINHPPTIRMESRSLAPLGSRRIPYRVPAELMREPGQYRLSFRLRSRAEPIYFMRFCGSTREMQHAMNEWMIDFHQSSIDFVVK